jgi:hypothetical protein
VYGAGKTAHNIQNEQHSINFVFSSFHDTINAVLDLYFPGSGDLFVGQSLDGTPWTGDRPVAKPLLTNDDTNSVSPLSNAKGKLLQNYIIERRYLFSHLEQKEFNCGHCKAT